MKKHTNLDQEIHMHTQDTDWGSNIALFVSFIFIGFLVARSVVMLIWGV